jgi:hypothetical protein
MAGCHSFVLFSLIHCHSSGSLSISSLRGSEKSTTLGCRAENWTRDYLSASLRNTNWATPHPTRTMPHLSTNLILYFNNRGSYWQFLCTYILTLVSWSCWQKNSQFVPESERCLLVWELQPAPGWEGWRGRPSWKLLAASSSCAKWSVLGFSQKKVKNLQVENSRPKRQTLQSVAWRP